MKQVAAFLLLIIPILQSKAEFAQTDALCKPLLAFVASTKPGEERSLEFKTVWGSNFKGDPDPALFGKRCNHYNYLPAEALCTYLLAHGSVEFAHKNAQRVLTCLSPKTKLESQLRLISFKASLFYGTEQRGSIVGISFDQDSSLGGMTLKIDIDGY